MGKDYSYCVRIYRQFLPDAMEYVGRFVHRDSSRFYIEDNRYYVRSWNNEKSTPTELDINQSSFNFDCTLVFDQDKAIVQYYLNWLVEELDLEDPTTFGTIKQFMVEKDKFYIGNIEVKVSTVINNDPESVYDFVDISFAAVTTNMSDLFINSKSIKGFFVFFAGIINAFSSYLYKESEGYELLTWDHEYMAYQINHPIGKYIDRQQFLEIVEHIFGRKSIDDGPHDEEMREG